jgi:hypothetical protein
MKHGHLEGVLAGWCTVFCASESLALRRGGRIRLLATPFEPETGDNLDGGVGLERKQQQAHLLSLKGLSKDGLDEGDVAWSTTPKSSPAYEHFVATFLVEWFDCQARTRKLD